MELPLKIVQKCQLVQIAAWLPLGMSRRRKHIQTLLRQLHGVPMFPGTIQNLILIQNCNWLGPKVPEGMPFLYQPFYSLRPVNKALLEFSSQADANLAFIESHIFSGYSAKLQNVLPQTVYFFAGNLVQNSKIHIRKRTGTFCPLFVVVFSGVHIVL